MSWQDELQPASFRGVPFAVTGHEAGFGRRTVTHEYPLRDKPFVEDMGRRARTLKVEALLVGANYLAARDRLLAALEKAGAGRLVHPYLGELQVSVLAVTLRESTANGGMATVGIECVESGALAFPSQAPSQGAAVNAAANAAREAVAANFVQAYAVKERPAFIADSAALTVTLAVGQMQAAAGSALAQANEVAALAAAALLTQQQLLEVVYSPLRVAQTLQGAMASLTREVAAAPREALAMARAFFTFGAELATVPQTTASRIVQAANQAAMLLLMRVTAVAEACDAVAELEFDSFEDAAQRRTELGDALDALMEQPLDTATFDALVDLRSAMVADVTARGADLARVVTYTPRQTLPALVLAYELYGDAARAEEIVLRNALPHPLFLRGRRSLEVLTDG